MSTAREINQVHRQVSSVTGLAAVALLVGIAVIGCAKHDGAPATAGSTPAAVSSQVDQPTFALTPDASDTPAPADSASPSPSSDAAASNAPATPDPLDSEINALNNLINGVNGSVSGSDTGASGGE
jgi:hypothetical protein